MYAPHEDAQHLGDRVLSMACPGFLTVADIKGDVGATRGTSVVPRLESVSSTEMRDTGCRKSLKSLMHMPVDKCRLCLLSKGLQDSHFLSKALYKIARKRGGSVVKTPELFIEVSNQVHDYLFCRGCEQLFSRNGEDYVMRLVKQFEGDFPLLKTLKESVPIAKGPNHGSVYSASELGIDTEKLAYYALSMFWRAAVHTWKTINQQTTSIRLRPEDEEAIRKYLIGEIEWPPGIVLQVTVCTDSISQDNVLAPVEWDNDMYKGCTMVVFGIFYMMVTGVKPGAPEWNLCCTTPPKSVIFLHTCESTTRMLLDDLRSKAKIADNLKGKKQSRTKG